MEHSVELPLGTDEALTLLARAAEAWGAEWQRQGNGGRLYLPVNAGVRRGVLAGTVSATESGDGTQLTYRVEESRYRLRWNAVVVLLFGLAGGVAAMLWPFFPQLLAFVPLALGLALAAWFLVVSQVRSTGVEEFLELVWAEAEVRPQRSAAASTGTPL